MPNDSPLISLAVAAGRTAGIVAKALTRSHKLDSFHGRTVVITGGSRGLGLLLAREFARQGARVAICARNEEQLTRARRDLEGRGARVWSQPCDITNPAQVGRFIEELKAAWGRIDVLVNNAGIVQVGPAQSMTADDFSAAMNTIFWGALNMTLAVLPEMRERREGRIVNITSVGAKVSVPHLLPYGCAKFALIALSEGLRAELAQDGITVVTIVPGLMRTGSHVNAMFKGRQQEESAWFSLSASAPLLAMDAERAARLIVRAARRGEAERTLGIPAILLARLYGLCPSAVISALSIANEALLPAPAGADATPQGREAALSSLLRFLDPLLRYGREAAERYGQV